jgi:hypothetical protein
MGIARSTYYDMPAAHAGDGELLAAITTICDEFEAYGAACRPRFAIKASLPTTSGSSV